MPDSTDLPLPFDPSNEPPEISPGEPMSDHDRVTAAAHGHYNMIRQALDIVDSSAYQAALAGVPDELLNAIEEQAFADHEEEAEAAAAEQETVGSQDGT